MANQTGRCNSKESSGSLCFVALGITRENGWGYCIQLLFGPFTVNADLNAFLACEPKHDDDQVSRIWRDWCMFYPLPLQHDLYSTNSMPKLVEVIVNNVTMKWPSALIVTPHGVKQFNADRKNSAKNVQATFQSQLVGATNQDLISSGQQNALDGEEIWDFKDCTAKTDCSCSKNLTTAVHMTGKPAAAMGAVPSKAALKFGMGQSSGQKTAKTQGPFHRRASATTQQIPAAAMTGSNAGGVHASSLMDSIPVSQPPPQSIGPVSAEPAPYPTNSEAPVSAQSAVSLTPLIPQLTNEPPFLYPTSGGGDSTRGLSPEEMETGTIRENDIPPVLSPKDSPDRIIPPKLTGAEPVKIMLKKPYWACNDSMDEDDEEVTAPSYTSFLRPIWDMPKMSEEDVKNNRIDDEEDLQQPNAAVAGIREDDSLPEDFMAPGSNENAMDQGNGAHFTSSSFMSPPPSTESQNHDDGIHGGYECGNAKMSMPSSPKKMATFSCVDYSKIFPTPPSMEAIPSHVYEVPMTASYSLCEEYDAEKNEMEALRLIENLPKPPEYKPIPRPPQPRNGFVGEPIQLPPHMIHHPAYGGSYHHPQHIRQQPAAFDSIPGRHGMENSFEMSPAPVSGSASVLRNPRTPASVQMQPFGSPPSNASSYPRAMNSVETPGIEAHGLCMNLLFADSVYNHYTDTSFDSCTLCACEMDMCGFEAGLYSPIPQNPQQNQQQSESDSRSNRCQCGFSASKARYLSTENGLFFEDEFDFTQNFKQPRRRRQQDWQPSLVDLIRVLCLGANDLDDKERDQPLPPMELKYMDMRNYCEQAFKEAVAVLDYSGKVWIIFWQSKLKKCLKKSAGG